MTSAAALELTQTTVYSPNFRETVGRLGKASITLIEETSGLYHLAQLVGYLYKGCEKLLGALPMFTEPQLLLGRMTTTIELFDLFGFADYWMTGKFKDDRPCAITGMAMMTFATVGGAALWLGEIGIPAVAEIAAEIGLGVMVTAGVTAGYAFLAADAIVGIVVAKNSAQRTQAILKLVSYTADAGLHVVVLIMFIPGVNIPGAIACGIIIPLGIVAKGFAIGSFIFSKAYDAEIKNKTKVQ
ncbi:MAG: hypothetical protein H7A37_01180 [Chlamydiales bacterium]|nr:hypothetical protein [Chlamydiia bacterium]MCP5506906.1 hypothetical protein [Chlamydiales bacterium]